MRIFPAIDILDGNAVRLRFGKRDMCDKYGSAVEFAEKWEEAGANYLHVVDLNGAFDGEYVNDEIIKAIGKNTKLTLQIGGGNRTIDRISKLVEYYGFSRIVVGSACVTDREMVEKAVSKFGNKIIAGLDAENNRLKIRGWVDGSDKTPLEVATDLKTLGITDIVFTDISRDGNLSGVNADSTIKLQKDSGMNVIASGGIAGFEDLIKLKELGVYGAILGRSLYEQKIDLSEAIKYAE